MIEGSRVRVSIVGVVVLALFCALFARLWYLQVAGGTNLATAANANRVRTVTEPAPRGRILDAKGRVLADNRVANVVTIDRRLDPAARKKVVAALAPLLGTTVEEIDQRLDDARVSPYTPVPVGVDVPIDTLAYIGEHKVDFPGVQAEPRAVRRYPQGSLAAHVLGYVGEINEEESAARLEGAYQLGDEIGKSGVEKSFEKDLRGKSGKERLEVDVQGRVLKTLGTTKPTPGNDVRLTLDLDVQSAAEAALAEAMAAAQQTQNRAIRESFATYAAPAGSVVVLDARTGSVVAMASNPTYDPNAFADGIPTATYEAYNNPDSHYPLLNRAIQGQYAPGSTFKLVTSLAGLTAGQISPGTTVNDKGCIDLEVEGGRFCNARSQAHGTVDLPEALTVSSDVYFYEIGRAFWGDFRRNEPTGNAIQDEARALGLGAPTGIALSGEAEGRVPDSAWKEAVNAERPDAFPYKEWLPGDNINLAVGQGDLLATPLQLASAYETVANGGTVFTPRLASQVLDLDGQVVREVPLTPKATVAFPDGARDAILSGLRGAVSDEKGTASAVFSGFPLEQFDLAGKTGTAEVTGKQDTSVFAAITPADPAPDQPQYVVVAIVEEGGFGADTAGPIVRRVVEALNGLAFTPIRVAGSTTAD
ncbi:MAG: penicillin-binding protein 2 [Acidimicrobiia bacterium]